MTTTGEHDRSGAGRLPLLPVVGADLAVPLVTSGTVRYANLDYAASSPALESVAERVRECLGTYSSVHRGSGWPSMISTALYEQARDTVGAFVGARSTDAVVFTRNTTDSLNLLASVVPADCHVVHLDTEHHGNLLSWQTCRHTTVPVAATVGRTLAALEAALAAAAGSAADRRPTLLSITGAGNVTGEVPPPAEVVALARAYGARVAVDGAQLVPHRRVDMAAQGIDYLAFSGHKVYAPFGAGVLVGKPDWLDSGAPYLRGGGAVHEVSAAEVEWAAAPARHEGGTPNLLGAVALAAACEALAALPADSVRDHEHALLDRLDSGLAELPEVDSLRVWPEDEVDRVAVRAFTVRDRDPQLLATYLSAEHGIGVRSGRFCAHQLVSRLVPRAADGPAGAPPPQAVRASMGVGSTLADVDRLLDALRELRDKGETWTYARQDGQWVPSPDPRSWGAARSAQHFPSPCGT